MLEHLGDILNDGSIKLEDKNRDYRRIRHTAEQKALLAVEGFTPVLSSNVSAAAVDGDDLLIRFHNGSLYIYPGSGNLYDGLMASNSKGRFIWTRLRRTNARYKKLQSDYIFKGPLDMTENELFEHIGNKIGNLHKIVNLKKTRDQIFDEISTKESYGDLLDKIMTDTSSQ